MKFEKMQVKLEQKGIKMAGALMKEITENLGEMIYGKLRQPQINYWKRTLTMDLFVINLTQSFLFLLSSFIVFCWYEPIKGD